MYFSICLLIFIISATKFWKPLHRLPIGSACQHDASVEVHDSVDAAGASIADMLGSEIICVLFYLALHCRAFILITCVLAVYIQEARANTSANTVQLSACH